jgi:alcohol dehydrogenase class IV
VINISSSNIKYGFGATKEVGFDMKELAATRVMVVTDNNLVEKEPVKVTLQSLELEGLVYCLRNYLTKSPDLFQN